MRKILLNEQRVPDCRQEKLCGGMKQKTFTLVLMEKFEQKNYHLEFAFTIFSLSDFAIFSIDSPNENKHFS